MRTGQFVIVHCDGCGLSADLPGSDVYSAFNQPNPEGWAGGDPLSWEIRTAFGEAFRDFCPDCLKLPFAELAAKITERIGAPHHGDGR